MKQKLLILLPALLAAVSVHAFSYTYEGQTLTYVELAYSPGSVGVSRCEYTATGDCIIPATVTNDGVEYPVIQIMPQAFADCFNLTSVKIPESVTTIEFFAFYNCTSLTSVEIPESVTFIGHSAFCNCTSLTSVEIPRSVTSISSYTFQKCSNLTSVVIPESVTTINLLAFSDCTSLISIAIPESVTKIGQFAFLNSAIYNDISNWENGVLYIGKHLIRAEPGLVPGAYVIKNGTLVVADQAFRGCGGLTSVTIPNSVTSIGYEAFYACHDLTSVTIPSSVTSIDDLAFEDCSGLTSVTIPNSVTSIALYTFYRCTSLTSVTIPNSVTSINEGAFYGCSGLTSVTIPNSVTSIGIFAFEDCSGLTSVTIPNSVTSIGEGAFGNCRNLTSVTLKNSDPSTITLEGDVFDSRESATLYVPFGSKELYAASDYWKEFGAIEEFKPIINLVDGQSYTETSDQQRVDVNYTRTFIPDIWQPLYVPFNMSYDEWKDYGQVAELSCVHAYEDGRTTIEFVTVNSGELLPNVPYVFLPNTGNEITFNCTNKTLKAAPAENTKYIMCSSPRYTFKIYGNYQPVSGSTLATYGDSQFSGAYVMTTDNKFQHCSPSATLMPYRFYITREKSTNGYWSAPARQNAPAAEEDDDVIYFMVDGKICGIADIVTDTDGNGTIYDLTGREVKNPSNGIYIQNGKKIRIY